MTQRSVAQAELQAVVETSRLKSEFVDSTRKSEMFNAVVASVIDYAIFLLDTNGKVMTWNAGAERFKGYRAEEIIGQHFSVFYPPEDVAAGKPEHELAAAASHGHVEDEGWRVRQNGTRFWANVVITAVRGVDGTLLGYGKITRRSGEIAARAALVQQSPRRSIPTGADSFNWQRSTMRR